MDWIQTFTGRRFYPLAPRVEDVDIRDIAHALSLQCRFNGHCLRFYSVAEHSVRVAAILDSDAALWGLLHDAGEAYLTDMPRPLKRQMPAFSEHEDRVLRVVATRFGLPWPMPEAVHQADVQLLATEARDLMAPPPASWELAVEPLPDTVRPWSSEDAERAFLDAFAQLEKGETR